MARQLVGSNGRACREMARQKLTRRDTLPPSIAALQKTLASTLGAARQLQSLARQEHGGTNPLVEVAQIQRTAAQQLVA